MSTKFSFLCALPRTGATFLGSMINQSKQIQMTPNSILPDVVINILKTRESSVFKNFPYFRGLENILLNTFENYCIDLDYLLKLIFAYILKKKYFLNINNYKT